MPNRKENAGAKYLREHYNEIVQRHRGEWVAANGQGVVAHHWDFARICSANAEDVAFKKMLAPALA